MPKAKKKEDLKATIESQLTALFEDNAEPSEGRMKLLKLGIAYLAVNAKLEESSYGEFFGQDELGDTGSVQGQPSGAEPDRGRRKKRSNGAAGEPGARAEGSDPAGEGT